MGVFDHTKPGVRKAEASILRLDLMSVMSVQMLDGTSLTPTGAKTRGLLAILALSDRRPVTRRALAGLLWSMRSEEQARASLRQEIHRLTEALSPLGTDILDVQRHALSLKPVLTSVDAERYLNATPSNILRLPETDTLLLSDLDGVDPALDEWLAHQRDRLRHHLISTLEQAQSTLSDPDQRLSAANRLLHVDRLNETGWRTLLRELARRNDSSTALLTAEQCLTTFRDSLHTEPSAATMAVISEVRHLANTLAHDMDAPPTARASTTTTLPAARDIASVAFTFPDRTTPLFPLVESVFDQATAGLARFGFLALFPPSPKESEDQGGPHHTHDYQIELKIRPTTPPPSKAPSPSARLVVRVTDQRRDNLIIWAERFTITADNADAIGAFLVTEIAWRIAMAEARNAASRPAHELSPLELGLRAFALTSRNDPAVLPQARDMLSDALDHLPENPFLLLIAALNGLLSSTEIPSPQQAAEARTRGIEAARKLTQLLPETVIGRLLLARLQMDDPSTLTFGRQLLIETLPSCSGSGIGVIVDAYATLLAGQAQKAARTLLAFRQQHPTHPFFDLLDTDFMLIFLLGGEFKEAAERGRTSLSAAPTRVSMLVLHAATLVALREKGHKDVSDELDATRAQLSRLAPTLSPEDVLAHHATLPSPLAETLLSLLRQAGLPASPEQKGEQCLA
ncbi:transcriptional activator domain [Acetobacter estunensis NRIC 0472]|nr:transcriptional activator domain [Acetobacter estunensis NRIC 0472]